MRPPLLLLRFTRVGHNQLQDIPVTFAVIRHLIHERPQQVHA
jgi:hypothetical protein